MSDEAIFGTDGIRGRAGEEWLAPRAVAARGRAAGAVLARGGGRVLLGHDGRRSGPELEAALAGGFGEAGVESTSSGLITTPGLAWLVREGDWTLGAMLSASHNPAADNGIKLFSSTGGKLSDVDQSAVEDALRADPQTGSAASEGPPLDPRLEEAYLDHLVDTIGSGFSLEGLPLVLDCANGAGSRVGPALFRRLGAGLEVLAAEPDGDNINAGCGSTHPEALQEAVARGAARIGVALDGDGDRCILVDAEGAVVHGDGIMTVIARHAAERGEYPDPRIVATVMSNRGLHRALREMGVGVVEVPVGDRAVVEGLRAEGLKLGGEQSGHIIFGDENHYIGDGLVTALRVLRVMRATGRELADLAAPYQPLPQVLLNVPVGSKPRLLDLPDLAPRVAAIEGELGEDGRVLLRYSGTENLARVMIEGPDAALIEEWADELAQMIGERIGAACDA